MPTVSVKFVNGSFDTTYDGALHGYLTEAEFASRIATFNSTVLILKMKGKGGAAALFCTLLTLILLFTMLLLLRGFTGPWALGALGTGIPITAALFVIVCLWMKRDKTQFNAAIDAICDRYNAHDYNKRIYYRLGQTFDHESSTNYRPELVISLGLRTTQYITTNNEVVIAMNAIHGEDDADTADTADHVDALPLYTPPQVTPSVDQPPLAPPSTVDGAPPKYVP